MIKERAVVLSMVLRASVIVRSRRLRTEDPCDSWQGSLAFPFRWRFRRIPSPCLVLSPSTRKLYQIQGAAWNRNHIQDDEDEWLVKGTPLPATVSLLQAAPQHVVKPRPAALRRQTSSVRAFVMDPEQFRRSRRLRLSASGCVAGEKILAFGRVAHLDHSV